jgi:hypothetical protein
MSESQREPTNNRKKFIDQSVPRAMYSGRYLWDRGNRQKEKGPRRLAQSLGPSCCRTITTPGGTASRAVGEDK